jgi:hypothetical protein
LQGLCPANKKSGTHIQIKKKKVLNLFLLLVLHNDSFALLNAELNDKQAAKCSNDHNWADSSTENRGVRN